MADVYLALVHHPVYNKHREVIASALTTIDMHDLARISATYGLAGYYAVTPVDDQLAVAREMIEHWCHGWGAEYNRNRREALTLARLARNLEEARADIERETGGPPLVIGTSAVPGADRVSFSEVSRLIEGSRPLLLAFGTAWGLTDEALVGCDMVLEPINGPTNYNHLSVRAAAAIIVDRLFLGTNFVKVGGVK